MLLFLYFLGSIDDGRIDFSCIGGSLTGDIMAYIVGKKFGSKIAPLLSTENHRSIGRYYR
jgi:CDP-diglyceride synthetase